MTNVPLGLFDWKKFHLKNDLDINKQSIKKSFEENYSWLTKEELKDKKINKIFNN